MRAASSVDRIALSAIATTSGGITFASRSPTPRSSSNEPRSRALTPDDPRTHAERPFQLGVVVGLDEHVEPELDGQGVQVGQQGVVGERRGDEQDCVRADGPGLEHLHLVDDEVLAQHRDVDRGASSVEVGDRPTEVSGVGQDRETRCTARAVRSRGPRRVEPRRQLTLRRGAALELGDDGQGVALAQRRLEAPGRRRVEGLRAQQVAHRRTVEHRDLVALGREDPVEDGHETAIVRRLTSRSPHRCLT